MFSPKTTILVVDDNPATRYSTSRVLRSAGWDVLESETGLSAIELAQTGVDLVILDVNLPDIDGFEVCRVIRANETSVRIPVLHLSATFVQDTHKIHGLESGADGYLTHPIEPPVLIATVNAFLRARQAETAFRQSETRFKAVFDSALNGVAVLSSSGQFIEANPALCSLLKLDDESLQLRTLFDFVAPSEQPIATEMWKQLTLASRWEGQFPLQRDDGVQLHLAWQMSGLPSGHRIAMVNDIGDQLRYEQEREAILQSERNARMEAEHANRLKDDFLATLSHELRTPLTAIVGWSQLLNMGDIDESTLREGLETIERNALAQSQMIADLLDVARITSGKIRLEIEQVYPAEILEAAIRAVLPAADAKEIRLVKALDPMAGPISGDASRLQQVFWNLLTNAIKFTPKQGRVHIALHRRKSHLEIRVADNGAGLAPELLTSIFERFRQADASTTREHGGLGLGLAIAKQLVELHGGTIHAESPGPGQGATFIVSIPVAPIHRLESDGALAGSQNDSSRTLNPISLTGVNILVVEDDADSRTLLRRIISGAGASVAEAASAQHALQILSTAGCPDLIISDVGMPHKDGLQMMQEIRALGFSVAHLPAIALTAFARAEDRRRSLLAGYQVHLTKPVDPLELTAAIASLLGRTGTPGL